MARKHSSETSVHRRIVGAIVSYECAMHADANLSAARDELRAQFKHSATEIKCVNVLGRVTVIVTINPDVPPDQARLDTAVLKVAKNHLRIVKPVIHVSAPAATD